MFKNNNNNNNGRASAAAEEYEECILVESLQREINHWILIIGNKWFNDIRVGFLELLKATFLCTCRKLLRSWERYWMVFHVNATVSTQLTLT
jgi:hypothetical protein